MNPSKVGPNLKSRILHLAAKGCPPDGKKSHRAIEAQLAIDGTPASHVTVGHVLREAKAQGWTGEGAKEEQELVRVQGKGPARGRVSAGEPTGAGTGEDAGEMPSGRDPVLPEGAGERAQLLHARLIATIRVSREVLAKVRLGSVPTAQWTEIEKEVSRQTERYYDALPPEKLEARHNPTNLAAREVYLDRVYMKVRSRPDRLRAIGR